VSGFLLDTNVISEMARPRPDPRIVQWIGNTDEDLLHLSVLTIGEIRRGIHLLAEGSRRAALEAWLDRNLVLRFSGRVLPVSLAVADRWGQISATAKRSTIPVVDGLLAATAIHHNLTIVSRDETFCRIAGVDLFNPWKV